MKTNRTKKRDKPNLNDFLTSKVIFSPRRRSKPQLELTEYPARSATQLAQLPRLPQTSRNIPLVNKNRIVFERIESEVNLSNTDLSQLGRTHISNMLSTS